MLLIDVSRTLTSLRSARRYRSAALRSNAFLRAPREPHTDDASLLVNVAPAQRSELAEPQAGVERERPDAAILVGHSTDDARRVGGITRMEALASSARTTTPRVRLSLTRPSTTRRR
jgi:hypothetical protein